MNSPTSIGLIIPSGNRLTEPQFNPYVPSNVGIHVTRLCMTGKFRKPLGELDANDETLLKLMLSLRNASHSSASPIPR